MSAIKNVGEGPISEIIAAREADGPFTDIDDFCSRVDLRHIGRRALEGLIKVGALDEFAPRHHLLAIIDRMINLSSSTHKASSVGQISMFDMAGFDVPQIGSILHPEPEDMEPIPQRELLSWEKELVGAYLSDHPMQKHMALIKAANTTMLGELDESMNGQQVTVVGMINSIRPHHTKKGEAMAFVEIEDIQAAREIVIFPRTYNTYQDLLETGKLIMVTGKVDAQEGRTPKVLADTITNEIKTYGAATEMTPPPSPPPVEEAALHMEPEAQPEPAASQEGRNGYGKNGNHQPAPVYETEATYHAVQPTPAQADAVAPNHLHITIPRTGNLAEDKHRLRMVYTLLIQYHGRDHFSFYIPNGSKDVQIDFPNQTTHYTLHLKQKLEMLGARLVRVD
jgi:DNA polymerase-3 subunit alpha